ncbi:Proteasome subunit alpha type-5-A [Asimina triloba]
MPLLWTQASKLQKPALPFNPSSKPISLFSRPDSLPIPSSTSTEYDRGVNTFSPEGRLFQVEYAIEAIKLGSTAIGLKTKEGVVLAVEKRITSPLLVPESWLYAPIHLPQNTVYNLLDMNVGNGEEIFDCRVTVAPKHEPSSVEKIMEIDEHIGCAMSGLIADARTLVEHARVETQNHRFSYGEPMTVESTTQALCDLALRFGEGDEESMVIVLPLYYTDPSGTFWQCNGKAIGSGSEGADSSLQEQYNKDLTLQEAETIALSILKQVMEEKVTPNNVDIAKVATTYHLYSPAEVEAVIAISFVQRQNDPRKTRLVISSPLVCCFVLSSFDCKAWAIMILNHSLLVKSSHKHACIRWSGAIEGLIGLVRHGLDSRCLFTNGGMGVLRCGEE